MNVEELSMIGPDVDLETVDSIHKKRLLAFINHFVINTSSFLNKLSKSCEQRFMTLESKIQKLEASIIILESKLNSVPGLEIEKPSTSVPVAEITVVEETKTEQKIEEDLQTKIVVEAEVNTEATKSKPELDPAYMKYVKMLQFGVPPQAVKLKMNQEGIDPSLFEEILSYK